MKKRPLFIGMCFECKPGDIIIAYDLSRLARNVREFLKFVEASVLPLYKFSWVERDTRQQEGGVLVV